MTLCANRPRSCPNIFSDFKCANGNCVDRSKICDLKDDCDDRTDERGCHEEGKCEDEIGGKLFCLSKNVLVLFTTYSGVQISWPLIFWAGSQSNHQNFYPSLLTYNC